MCIAPVQLPNGVLAGCRKCWQCRELVIMDYVGRCFAESKTAKACHAVTLTYGPDEMGNSDHPRAAVLTYSDVQKYVKKLRKNGYPCRYFSVGEYGSKKGRAHWHLIMFWSGKLPEHKLNKRFNETNWEHGLSFWEEPTPESFKYACKYIQKDIGHDERQGHLGMSKIPPLGTLFFQSRAEEYAKRGLAPQSKDYRFDECRGKGGRLIQFQLRGKSLDNYLSHYVECWKLYHGEKHMPNSELVEEWLDAQVNLDDIRDIKLEARTKPRVIERPPEMPEYGVMQFSESVNNWFYMVDGKKLWWSWDPKTKEREWLEKINPDPDGKVQSVYDGYVKNKG